MSSRRRCLRQGFDPHADFKEKVHSFEIRFDPLLGKPSYVYEVRRLTSYQEDLPALVAKSLNTGCPFCPGAIGEVTPKFIADLLPQGRLQLGEACIFPNAVPYAPYSAITVLSRQHFVALPDFTQKMLTDALMAAQTYLKRVHQYDAGAKYIYLGWNYMPPSGASQVHPHLQVEAAYLPAPYQQELLQASQKYYTANGSNFWHDLVAEEESLEERYIGETGDISWLASYAPRGKLLDVLAIFKHRESFLDISGVELGDFSLGLVKVLRYINDQGYYSFNMSINSGLSGEGYFWTHARIIPRMAFFGLAVSDCSYYDVLQDLHFSSRYPEENCRELKKYFGERGK